MVSRLAGGRQAEACSGEDEDKVEGGPLLEGLEGLEGGSPLEGKGEGGPLLEGLEGGTSLEGKVEGGPLLEGLEGGTPLEGKLEGGPLLEGLEGGTPLEGKVEGGPLLEGLEGATPLEGMVEVGPLLEGLEVLEERHPREGVGFRNRTGLGDRSQLRSWREMWNRVALQTNHPQSDSP
ncbi:unnamed protein product [Boreogadus saida]